LTPTEIESTTSAENQPEAAHDHTHDHHHDHNHTHDHSEDLAPGLHQHSHQHGPSLNPELAREIAVEVPADEVSKAFRSVMKRYQKLARIPGFRAGKVPESLIKTKFAKEVRQEVLESLVSDRFKQAIDEQKLVPVSQPQMVDMQLLDGAATEVQGSIRGCSRDRHYWLRQHAHREADATLTAMSFKLNWTVCSRATPSSSRSKKIVRWSMGTGQRSSSRARSKTSLRL
jgi:hypothetical protein